MPVLFRRQDKYHDIPVITFQERMHSQRCLPSCPFGKLNITWETLRGVKKKRESFSLFGAGPEEGLMLVGEARSEETDFRK